MKRTRNLSPYAQELISSGRGDRLIKQFCRALILSKKVPDYRKPHKEVKAKHKYKVTAHADSVESE